MGKTRERNEKQSKKGGKKTKKMHITKDAFIFSKKLTVDKRGSNRVLGISYTVYRLVQKIGAIFKYLVL